MSEEEETRFEFDLAFQTKIAALVTRDSKFAQGPVALQWGRGTIKWRKVEIRPI